MWGQVQPTVAKMVFFGIIPTRVGTSWFSISIGSSGQDHPHACGDKHIKQSVTANHLWIIPTRVGTRRKLWNVDTYTKDHPHACGDKT